MNFQTQILRYTDEELASLIEDETATEALGKEADEVRRANYGTEVYVRGLIEFSNYCKNDCYYCGIRKGNRKAERYRLSFDFSPIDKVIAHSGNFSLMAETM